MRNQVTDYILYRRRFLLGYLFIFAVVTVMVVIASVYVPGGLREAEIASSLQSGKLSVESLEPPMVIDLPYHILQRVSFMLFGVSIVSIKLPSILLGIATAVGFFLLARTWFRRNVAIISTLLAVCSAQFLFLIQDGTSDIMYSFLTIWILFAATYVTRKKLFGTFWKVLTGALMATALYTPLGIYLVLAVLTTAFFHPHIRYTILRFSRPRLWIGVILGIVSIVPLVYASVIDKTVLFTLLGLPQGDLRIKDNLVEIASLLFGVFPDIDSHMMRPIYSLGLLLICAVGVYKLLTYKHTARSYITLSLSVLMLPLIVFNPDRITYLLPLILLFTALGIATLITDWYKLFPRNPYARIAGLVPLAVLVIGVAYTGVERYMYNYIYSPTVATHYSNDLRLFSRAVTRFEADKPVAVVAKSELPFYQLVAEHDSRFSVMSDMPVKGTRIVSHLANKRVATAEQPSLIITNRLKDNADRFYIYKSVQK